MGIFFNMRKHFINPPFIFTFLLLAFFLISSTSQAEPNKELIINPTFEKEIKPWHPYFKMKVIDTEGHSGTNCVEISHTDVNNKGGVFQKIMLNQKEALPVILSGWSKAENVKMSGIDNKNYCLKALFIFDDGSRDWKFTIPFNPSINNWQYVENIYQPQKPIKEITVYALFNKYTGNVKFDDISLKTVPGTSEKKTATGCSIKNTGTLITLENSFIKIVFDSANGASCDKFLYKSADVEFAGSGEYRAFTDRIREAGKTVRDKPFKWKIEYNSKEKVSVRFSLNDLKNLPGLEMQKIITLKKDNCSLFIDYNYINQKTDNEAIIASPYFRHGLIMKNQNFSYFIPKENGIESIMSESGSGNAYHKDITRDWIALSNNEGTGIACEFDYKYLDQAYNWIAGKNSCTLEWGFIPIKIDAGKTFHTRCVMTPFNNVKNITGVSNGYILGVTEDKNKISCAIFSNSNAVRTISIGGEASTSNINNIFEKHVNFAANTIAECQIPKPKAEALICSIYNGNEKIASIDKPLVKTRKLLPLNPKAYAASDESKDVVLSTKVETPHVKWAKPYSKGIISVLGIGGIEKARELVELAQRIEIKVKTVRISNSKFYVRMGMMDHYANYTYLDANRSLKNALKENYDVIIVSGPMLKHINKDNLQAIKDKLDSGTGLILITPQNLPDSINAISPLQQIQKKDRSKVTAKWSATSNHFITSGIPVTILPGTINENCILKGKQLIGSGNAPLLAISENSHRVVGFSYKTTIYVAGHSLIPYFPFDGNAASFSAHEYYYSLLAKAVVWAADKAPEIDISKFLSPKEKLSFNNHTGDTLNLELYNHSDIKTINIEITFKDLESKIQGLYETQADLKNGTNKFSIPLPAKLRPGLNFADLRLKTGNKIINWGSAYFYVSYPAKIENLQLENILLNPGQQLKGKIAATNNVPDSKNHVIVQLRDSLDRVVRRLRFDNSKNLSFSFNLPQKISIISKVECLLYNNDFLIDKKYQEVTVTPAPRDWDEFIGIIAADHWRYCFPKYLSETYYEIIRKSGFTGFRFCKTKTDYIREYLRSGIENLYIGDVAAQHIEKAFKESSKLYSKTKDKKYLERNPCLSDDKYLEKIKQYIPLKLKPYLPYKPLVCRLGDENSLTHYNASYDFCFAKETLEKFRKWLQNQYGNLESLNNEWDTTFTKWEDVIPFTTDEIKTRTNRNYAPWADHRTFMDNVFSDFYAYCRDVCKNIDPDIFVSISGTQVPSAYSGYDYSKICKALPAQIQPYTAGCQWELVSSFGGKHVTPWFAGYGSKGTSLRYKIWESSFLFNGAGIPFFSDFMALNPDFTESQSLLDYSRFTKDLRSGIGRILRAAQKDEPDILIHYSHPSLQLSAIEDNYSEFNKMRKSWVEICQDCGFTYKFISYSQIENGDLSRTNTKVLILPMSKALSQKEADEIKSFVKNGGIVISDCQPGTFDEHCKIRNLNVMQDLLGVSTEKENTGTTTEIAVKDIIINAYLPNEKVKIHNATCVGFSKEGNKPSAFYENSFGKGYSLYLNLQLDYDSLKKTNIQKASEYLSVLKSFISQKPIISINSTDPEKPAMIRMFRYHDKGKYFIATINKKGNSLNAKNFTINLPERFNVYDVRNTKFLGYTKQFSCHIDEEDAAFYALLPFKIKDIILDQPKDKIICGENFDYDIKLTYSDNKITSNDIVRLKLLDPSGKESYWDTQNITCQNGKYSGNIQIPFNAKCGIWKLSAQHTISGKLAEVFFSVSQK